MLPLDRPAALLAALMALATLPAQGGPRQAQARVEGPAVRLVDDLQYAEGISRDARRNRLDLYLPEVAPAKAEGPDGRKLPLLVFVHGGAWMGGDKARYRRLGEAVARKGLGCAVTNYRLSPLVQHPAHVEDCARAVAFLHAHAGEHGCDPDRVFLMGHSAGGHLVALLALDPAWLRAAGAPDGVVKGCIPLSGPMDVRPPLPLFDGVFGRDPEVRAQASPATLVEQGRPPMFLLWAQRDMAGLEAMNRLMARKLEEVSGLHDARELRAETHASYLRRIGGSGDVLLGPVVEFVQRRCAELDAAGAVSEPAKAGGARQPGEGHQR